MEARELRIGNWVNTMKGHRQCIDVMCDCVNFEDIERDIFDNIDPIPLTEEWLVRFGLKLNPNHTAFHIKGMQFEIPSMIGGFYDNEYGLDKESVIELNYVHSLQNLYFALTGEELELKS